jgi:polyisoprenoid-binding protein YceI
MNKFVRMSFVFAVALVGNLAVAQAAVYKIDPQHSSISFRVRHLAGHVTGQFDKFEGTFEYDPANIKVWKASATIDASSIDTKVDARDKHLRSDDFLDVAENPTLTFVSTKATGLKGDHAKLLGKLTIHGVTKKIALDLEIGGVAKDGSGNQRAAFTATTTIKRGDYGLTWNNIVEGVALVGEQVEITIEAEGIRQ